MDRLKFPSTLSSASVSACLTILLLWVAVFAVWNITLAIHRLYFHPLKSYPGPFFARISDFYNTFHIFVKDEAQNFHKLHECYGPVVRYGPNRLSIATPGAVRMLYTNSRYTRKADSYLAFPRDPANASLFSSINKEVHARKRRVLRYGFSDSALKEAEVTIKKHVAILLRCLEHLADDDQHGWTVDEKKSTGQWSTPKNWAEWINRYSFDLSTELSLSESFNMMRLGERRHFADLIHENMWAENVTGSALTLLHSLGLRNTLLSRWVRTSKPFDDFVERAAAARIEQTTTGVELGKKDFMTWLTNDADPNKDVSMDEIKEEAILLITAGGDTTSTTISAAMYYLLHDPEKLQKLQAEIRQTFSSVEDIRLGSALNSCTYLRACIEEALRIAPPAGSVLRREVEVGGVHVDGLYIPRGTNVGVPVSAMHHDAAYFPSPLKFQPERWIPGSVLADGTEVTHEFVKRAYGAFLPFSAGTRGCIGKPLAYLGISILYATMLFQYDMRLCRERWANGHRSGLGPDPTIKYELEDIFTSWKNGPLVEFKARQVE
ncbi:Cytochrome P450 3A31 [Pyrenophora tritici-repentis]|nr:Cytochrome P450 3A31 [Pyrenophora tritici-repentis]KAI0575269.1 Cytochrome P450 3A31 [Pyrenophora tritici-repentis]KAI1527409.1 CypX Cytochrome P450 [Pyrenophora tritici-repentis]KAI1582100.1 CypX Cytochrome P450 [Pyrenophora tritici-repentis]KAI1596573.1 CypX Cytochrome P450 [Pyrenophora tritici-repentis]